MTNHAKIEPNDMPDTPPTPVEILIAEDSPTQARRLKHMLEQQGYKAVVASNGVQALDMATQRKPTMIISDVMMPEMDGYELCRRVKSTPTLSDVPVFLVTSLSDPQDVISGLECRADNFILKPYDANYLLSRVQYMLLNTRMQQSDGSGMGVEIYFNSRRHFITSNRLQILNLLIATYDAAIQRNRELTRIQEDLRGSNLSLTEANGRLEQEIRERKSAEDALRASESRLREMNENLESLVVARTGELKETATRFQQLAANINEVFWLATIGEKRRLLYISPAYEKVWGRSPADLFESMESWVESIHPEDREHVVEAARTNQSDGTYAETYRIVRPDGGIRWIEDRGFPVRNEAGEVFRIAGVARDVTDLKQTEDAKRKLEEQLRQSQKMEAIGQLAGGIAHDFNNLLTVINGYSQLIVDRYKPDPKTKDALELIYRTGERAAELTRQLLAFSRKQVVNTKVLNLNAVAADMEKMLHRLIGENISLASAFDPALASVNADSNQLEQVIMNLAVNARDAMGDGGLLTLETKNIELTEQYCASQADVKPGRYVMLAVSDTGCGMDEKTRARIFEPFFTTKDPGKGTGLGLATVYGIVKQNRGHIEVYSEPGHGTTFKIYLPATGDSPTAAFSGQFARVTGGNETILAVEDVEGIRTLIREVLQGAGFTVLIAPNGETALKMWRDRTSPIHIVVTDVVMTGMSGLDLARAIRKEDPTMKVLFTSGYTDYAVSRRGILDEGAHFLQKPFNPSSLKKKIRDVLDENGD